MEVVFTALLISKTMFKDNNEWYVRLEFSQEKGSPPAVINPTGDPIFQGLMPMLQQVMRSIYPQASLMPRLILILREDEWEKLENKPDIGDEVTIKFSDNKEIIFKKS